MHERECWTIWIPKDRGDSAGHWEKCLNLCSSERKGVNCLSCCMSDSRPSGCPEWLTAIWEESLFCLLGQEVKCDHGSGNRRKLTPPLSRATRVSSARWYMSNGQTLTKVQGRGRKNGFRTSLPGCWAEVESTQWVIEWHPHHFRTI